MDVSQNLITLNVTDQQLQTVRTALDQIEAALPGLISMETGDRRGLMLMGPKSEAFARQTLRVLEQNPKIVPPSFDLAAAKADLAAFERLQPLLERVERLASWTPRWRATRRSSCPAAPKVWTTCAATWAAASSGPPAARPSRPERAGRRHERPPSGGLFRGRRSRR